MTKAENNLFSGFSVGLFLVTVLGRSIGICIFRCFQWRRVFEPPNEPKCGKYQSNLTVCLSKLAKVESPKSSESSGDPLLTKRIARKEKINFYGVFGSSDISFD